MERRTDFPRQGDWRYWKGLLRGERGQEGGGENGSTEWAGGGPSRTIGSQRGGGRQSINLTRFNHGPIAPPPTGGAIRKGWRRRLHCFDPERNMQETSHRASETEGTTRISVLPTKAGRAFETGERGGPTKEDSAVLQSFLLVFLRRRRFSLRCFFYFSQRPFSPATAQKILFGDYFISVVRFPPSFPCALLFPLSF